MSSYYGTPPRSDELYHYGVLGMKWGVHRARKLAAAGHTEKAKAKLDATYAKSAKKLAKIDRKIEKYQAKSVKYRQKADRNAYGWFGSQKKAQRQAFKADRQQFKANKKAAKGLKHIQKMQQVYKDTSLKHISKEHEAAGRRYEQMLRTRAQSAMR